MAWSFNVFTGNLDQTGSSGAVVFEGEVETFADLPEVVGDPPVGSSYLVRTSTGVWLVNRRQAGIWIRRNNTGVRATDWEYGGDYPVNSVNGQTGNVSLTAADVGVNFAAPPAIGSTTPAAGTFTNLVANTELQVPSAAAPSPSAGDIYRVTDTIRYRDSGNTERLLLNAADNLSNLANTATARTNIGLGSASDVTLGSLQNTPIGSTTRNSGAFTTLSAAPTSGSALTLTGGTVTASAPVLDASQTWNASGTTFTGMRFVITNTASDHRSLLFSLDDGATPSFGVQSIIGVPIVQATRIFGGSRGIRIGSRVTSGAGNADFIGIRWQQNTFTMLDGTEFGWSTQPYDSSPNLALHRDAADTLAQRRGTNAQTFRLYNTFTDASNYERGFMRWSSNILQIGTEKLGTGSARALELSVDGNRRFSIGSNGEVNIGTSTGLLSSHGICVSVAGQQTSIAHGTGRILVTSAVVTMNSDVLRVDSGRVMFSGTTSSFPALKRDSTALQVRLADDSAYSVLDAQLRAQGTAPATSGAAGTAGDIRYDADYIYVCTAASTWKRAAIATW